MLEVLLLVMMFVWYIGAGPAAIDGVVSLVWHMCSRRFLSGGIFIPNRCLPFVLEIYSLLCSRRFLSDGVYRIVTYLKCSRSKSFCVPVVLSQMVYIQSLPTFGARDLKAFVFSSFSLRWYIYIESLPFFGARDLL